MKAQDVFANENLLDGKQLESPNYLSFGQMETFNLKVFILKFLRFGLAGIVGERTLNHMGRDRAV